MAYVVILVWCLWIHRVCQAKPNILFMFGDDIGFNDMQFTSSDLSAPSTDTSTPNLNELASNGVMVTNYYVHRMCSPTRAAFLSGRLPFRYSMNTGLLQADVALSLTRQVSLISEEFKAAGYQTHAVGKWHLGFQSWEYTPTYRGFDSFYGYYNAFTDYYLSNYDIVMAHEDYQFFDLRNNEETVKLDGDPSDYSVYRFRDEAIQIIEESDGDTPFFLYLAWQSSHVPSEAPDYYSNMYCASTEDKETTRVYNQAQTTSMDDAIGVLIQTLKANEMWDNTLLVFSSDNGAAASYGDNFPLRGYKKTTFEGGLRVPALMSGGYLPERLRGTTFGSDEVYVHVTDWYPTLLEAAGIEPSYVKSTRKVDDRDEYTPDWESALYTVPLDGASIWNQMIDASDSDAESVSPRLMILDIIRDDANDCLNGTVRWGKWKYVKGLGTYGTDSDGDDGYLWGEAFADLSDTPHLWGQQFANLEVDNALGCDLDTEPTNLYCFYSEKGCLFDIAADPCEFTDLSDERPHTLQYLKGILEDLENDLPTDLMHEGLQLTANSSQHWIPSPDGFWGPWQKYEAVTFESMLYDDYNRLYGAMNQESVNYNYFKWSWHIFAMFTVAIAIVSMLQCKIKRDTCQKTENKYNFINYGSTDM